MNDILDAIRRLDAALRNNGFGPARVTLATWEDLATLGTLALRQPVMVHGWPMIGDDEIMIAGVTIDAPPRQRHCTHINGTI